MHGTFLRTKKIKQGLEAVQANEVVFALHPTSAIGFVDRFVRVFHADRLFSGLPRWRAIFIVAARSNNILRVTRASEPAGTPTHMVRFVAPIYLTSARSRGFLNEF
jgi:hypothetical protein